MMHMMIYSSGKHWGLLAQAASIHFDDEAHHDPHRESWWEANDKLCQRCTFSSESPSCPRPYRPRALFRSRSRTSKT